jgi:uncharacterized repeat protein (TIGR03803 family)
MRATRISSLLAMLVVFVSANSAHAGKTLTYTLLHNFCTVGDCADGDSPISGLTRDGKGNLFGTAETGGAHNNGVVFELERHHKHWTYKVLHDFCFACGDGDFPMGGLIADVTGNIYGTADGGGAHDCGIVFRISPATKKYEVLHDFCAQDGDGDSPDQALSYAGKKDGVLYDGVSPLFGTTANGGANGRGTVFSLTPNGKRWKLRSSTLFVRSRAVRMAERRQERC